MKEEAEPFVQQDIFSCSLAVLADLIGIDEESASQLLSHLCGLDSECGLSAIRYFQNVAKLDSRWLTALSRVDSVTMQKEPYRVMGLLIDGFGLEQLEALDATFRLSAGASRPAVRGMIN